MLPELVQGVLHQRQCPRLPEHIVDNLLCKTSLEVHPMQGSWLLDRHQQLIFCHFGDEPELRLHTFPKALETA